MSAQHAAERRACADVLIIRGASAASLRPCRLTSLRPPLDERQRDFWYLRFVSEDDCVAPGGFADVAGEGPAVSAHPDGPRVSTGSFDGCELWEDISRLCTGPSWSSTWRGSVTRLGPTRIRWWSGWPVPGAGRRPRERRDQLAELRHRGSRGRCARPDLSRGAQELAGDQAAGPAGSRIMDARFQLRPRPATERSLG